MTTRVIGGSTYNLSYDTENHLTGVSGAATASFVYDGDGNRVKGTVSGATTVYIGNHFEWTSVGNTKYYYHGATRLAMRRIGYASGNGVFFLLGDHLGSTSLTTDSSGGNPTELRYKPWGEIRFSSGTTQTTFRFTGQRQEAALGGADGLYVYGARWYDSALGRFTSADTVIPEASQGVQAWDRYAFVNNNPLRYSDPTGHWIESAIDIISIGYDVYDISSNGLNWENGLSLVADVVSLALPVVAGGGMLVRAAMHADDAVDALQAANAVGNVVEAANQADNLADALAHTDEASDFIRAVPIDQVGTSQPFNLRPGEDGLSVFENVPPDAVLAELPGINMPNTTVTIPGSQLPSGTQVIPKPAPGLSQALSYAHRILVRPEGWSVKRFAKAIKGIVGWE